MIQSVLDLVRDGEHRHFVMVFNQDGLCCHTTVQDLNDLDDSYFNSLHQIHITTIGSEDEYICRSILTLSLITEEGVPLIYKVDTDE